MNNKQGNEVTSNDEINLYDYWVILVKRKKIFFGVFLVPLVLVIIISLIMPRYYRGESEIRIPALIFSNAPSSITADNIVNLVGNIDAQKNKIFVGNSTKIRNVIIVPSKKSKDKVDIIITADTPNIMPDVFKIIISYINNLPEIKDENDKAEKTVDLKIRQLTEVKEANAIFLNQVTDMMKKRQISFININPSDLVRKDADLSLEIETIKQTKQNMIENKEFKVDNFVITKQPSDAKVRQIIIVTAIISLMAAVSIVFFLNYIERLKRNKN